MKIKRKIAVKKNWRQKPQGWGANINFLISEMWGSEEYEYIMGQIRWIRTTKKYSWKLQHEFF